VAGDGVEHLLAVVDASALGQRELSLTVFTARETLQRCTSA
jgi:hypothetical protein